MFVLQSLIRFFCFLSFLNLSNIVFSNLISYLAHRQKQLHLFAQKLYCTLTFTYRNLPHACNTHLMTFQLKFAQIFAPKRPLYSFIKRIKYRIPFLLPAFAHMQITLANLITAQIKTYWTQSFFEQKTKQEKNKNHRQMQIHTKIHLSNRLLSR